MNFLSEKDIQNIPHAATIGFFDGVHLGHQYLLGELHKKAIERNLKSLVVTFSNSPHHFFKQQGVEIMLSLPNEKCKLIDKMGIDDCLLLDFNQQLAVKTAKEFMQYLQIQFGVQHILMGYDHRFGSDGKQSHEEYERQAKELGITLEFCKRFSDKSLNISSSEIRAQIDEGAIEKANQLLGYEYMLTGKVVGGQKIGRTLGFPTANLEVDDRKRLPKNGIYVVTVSRGLQKYKGVMSIGTRPTVHGTDRTIEVYILDFSEEIYGETISVAIERFIRDEQYFSSLEELKEQIAKDVNEIK